MRTREPTITWLAEHGRAEREAVADLCEAGLIPVLALDDEPGNVDI